MNFTVTGLTVETEGVSKEQLEQAKIFSGKNAGICYMGDSYFDSAVTDPDKALKRFVSTANNAHHSIADHVRVEVLLEGVSKMLAIVLNSLQDYATSEKSGRYTIMTGNSERETELYNKWKDIFEQSILASYPDYNDIYLAKKFSKVFVEHEGNKRVVPSIKNGNFEYIYNDISDYYKEQLEKFKSEETLPSKKLAQENARYILSVFTYSTTMGYSTSIRQWNYIYDWCMKYCNQFSPKMNEEYAKILAGQSGYPTIISNKTGAEASYFETRLYFDFLKLSNFIYDNLYIKELRDTKNRCFEFLTSYSGEPNHPMINYRLSYDSDNFIKDDYLGLVYNVSYPASFVHIAQAERHRTLKYFMISDFSHGSKNFFVPPIIEETKYKKEWLKDLNSVADIIPQATVVGIIETGYISDFILKCEERLCGRAQWEIMSQTRDTANRFIDAVDDLKITNPACIAYIDKLRDSTVSCKTKCKLLGDCKEGCYHGANSALTRSI